MIFFLCTGKLQYSVNAKNMGRFGFLPIIYIYISCNSDCMCIVQEVERHTIWQVKVIDRLNSEDQNRSRFTVRRDMLETCIRLTVYLLTIVGRKFSSPLGLEVMTNSILHSFKLSIQLIKILMIITLIRSCGISQKNHIMGSLKYYKY